MKKIAGILGITLIMAVSFFNMSSLTNAKQNVDLASILQSASAQDEGAYGYKDKYETNYIETVTTQVPTGGGKWKTCTGTYENHIVECTGIGLKDCTPTNEMISLPGSSAPTCWIS